MFNVLPIKKAYDVIEFQEANTIGNLLMKLSIDWSGSLDKINIDMYQAHNVLDFDRVWCTFTTSLPVELQDIILCVVWSC